MDSWGLSVLPVVWTLNKKFFLGWSQGCESSCIHSAWRDFEIPGKAQGTLPSCPGLPVEHTVLLAGVGCGGVPAPAPHSLEPEPSSRGGGERQEA